MIMQTDDCKGSIIVKNMKDHFLALHVDTVGNCNVTVDKLNFEGLQLPRKTQMNVI